MSESDDIVKEFLIESTENLDQLDRDLIELEKDPTSKEILSSIFRTIHTIKGTTGFLGFSKLENLAHSGESLLGLLRDGRLSMTPEITSALLALVDAVRGMLAAIESTGRDGDSDFAPLIETLRKLQDTGAAPPVPKVQPEPSKEPKPVETDAPVPLGRILIQSGQVTEDEVANALAAQQAGDPRHVGEILVEQGAIPPGAVRAAVEEQTKTQVLASAANTIRVDVGQLDKLMNLVGELVLARNQILQFSATQQDASLLSASQRLNLITTELQEGVMKTRMQPIDNVWNKLPRMIRDLALASGKQVHVDMEGKETELDKTVIEAIKDPLTHVIRNAVDHGIEAPEQRSAAGKSTEGRVSLRAYHEGGQVNIEISDDGAGIAVDRVKRKAVDRGLITPEHAARMGEREALNLIFLPGLSTAEKVTNVSGRGVGMDVVKTNLEKISGTIDIHSQPGQGTMLKIKIPLTLAIIPALIITSAGDRYAIPQISLLELVRLEGDEAKRGIENIHGAPVYRLRGNLLPLVYLNHELGLTDSNVAGGLARQRLDFQILDFEAAKSAHAAWKVKLREFLDGQGTLNAEEVGRNDRCALGKWIYSPGMNQYRQLSALAELETAHTQLHVQAKKVIVLNDSGDLQQAERELAEIETLSSSIVSLIGVLQGYAKENAAVNIVVLQADDRSFGLVVDEVNDTEEIVVKPLGKHLKGIETFAGATIMGDGRVALILDVMGLAHRANVISEVREHALAEERSARASAASGDWQAVLLFQSPDNGRMAIPLSLVTRLEEFPRTSIEKAGNQEVMQYRDTILPLVHLSTLLDERRRKPRRLPEAPPAEESIQVVVYSDQEFTVGLIVERILDIVEEDLARRQVASRDGILGTLVVQGRVTEILDLESLVRTHAAFRSSKDTLQKVSR
jgi:chemotaxis protein histidine kinase CheA